MDDVARLSRLLDVCRSVLARAEAAEFPPDATFIADLRRYTISVEAQLEAAQRRGFAKPSR